MRRATAALLVASTCLPAGAAPEAALADYLALLRRYAGGERTQAVAALGGWSRGDLDRMLRLIEGHQRNRERCPTCPNPVADGPWQAGAMLHWDRHRSERPAFVEPEEQRRCTGDQARLASRFAGLLARRPATREFARRFFLALVAVSQWDACFDEAHDWARRGLDLFPDDAELLFARGSSMEKQATLPPTGVNPYLRQALPLVRAQLYKDARSDLASAVAANPDLVLARVHLGRVLWHLEKPEQARAALEEALSRARDPQHLYLAHLFLGRLHEDARRLDPAIASYRKALENDPDGQAAAVGLSHVLRLVGEGEASRAALVRCLFPERPRSSRDPYWNYLSGNLLDIEALFAELRRESAR